jgi:hypothetical protein
MVARCEAELDIFSGMPNPTWVLTDPEVATLFGVLARMPRTSERAFSGHLGYRGFIVRCTEGADTQVIRVQAGTIQISSRGSDAYARDDDRRLERWLRGRAAVHLKDGPHDSLLRELP